MSTQQVKIYDEISLVENVAPNLWEVDRCFGEATHQWLRSIPDNYGNEFFNSGLAKRLQLKFGTHDYARLNQIGLDMIPTLSELTGIKNLGLIETKYWIDLPEFGCQEHSDAEDIVVSYQVYLRSTIREAYESEVYLDATSKEELELLKKIRLEKAYGARFNHVDPFHIIDFKSNHGYINLNTDLKKHEVYGTWDTRTSVMFQYNRV